MDPCGKVWFLTESDATQAMEKIISAPYCREADTLNVYFCNRCEGFHFGHNFKLASRSTAGR